MMYSVFEDAAVTVMLPAGVVASLTVKARFSSAERRDLWRLVHNDGNGLRHGDRAAAHVGGDALHRIAADGRETHGDDARVRLLR